MLDTIIPLTDKVIPEQEQGNTAENDDPETEAEVEKEENDNPTTD